MGGLSYLFSHGCMLLLWDHRRICRPEVSETMPLTIPLWNGLPQPLTRFFTPIIQGIGHHMTRLAAEGHTNPGVVGFFDHKRPQYIQCQLGSSGIFWIGGKQGGT